MDQRVTLITLGVADVGRARAFYEALGWTAQVGYGDEVAFFQAGRLVVGLWGRDLLAEDSGVADGGGWGGVALAQNLPAKADVDAVMAQAAAAGARVTREPHDTFYGGYAGVFVDPDGHAWEIAWNPGFPLDPDGAVTVPPGRFARDEAG
jgi:uncharacterized protein